MRKSERLRLLEIELVRLQMQVEFLSDVVANMLDSKNDQSDLDAGKWYVRKPQQND